MQSPPTLYQAVGIEQLSLSLSLSLSPLLKNKDIARTHDEEILIACRGGHILD